MSNFRHTPSVLAGSRQLPIRGTLEKPCLRPRHDSDLALILLQGAVVVSKAQCAST